jgi:hypothetical protein
VQPFVRLSQQQRAAVAAEGAALAGFLPGDAADVEVAVP